VHRREAFEVSRDIFFFKVKANRFRFPYTAVNVNSHRILKCIISCCQRPWTYLPSPCTEVVETVCEDATVAVTTTVIRNQSCRWLSCCLVLIFRVTVKNDLLTTDGWWSSFRIWARKSNVLTTVLVGFLSCFWQMAEQHVALGCDRFLLLLVQFGPYFSLYPSALRFVLWISEIVKWQLNTQFDVMEF